MSPHEHFPGKDRGRASMRLAPAQGVLLEQQGERLFLIDHRTGSRQQTDAFGHRIWNILLERPTFSALVDRLSAEYRRRSDIVVHDAAVRLFAWQQARFVDWVY